MSHRSFSDPESLDLFDKSISLDASESELRKLNGCLCHSPKFLEEYRNFASLHADLAGVVRLSRVRQVIYEDIRARAAGERLELKGIGCGQDVREELAETTELYFARQERARRRSILGPGKVIRPAWLAVAATLLLVLLLVKRSGQDDFQAALKSQKPNARGAAALTSAAGKDIVAYVTCLDSVVWEAAAVQYERHDALTRDHPLLLAAGQLEIEFVDGARVTLAGPAEFIVRSEWSADLRKGRLSADVPAWATGFTVNAPHFRAVDRGTSFALAVEENEDSGAVVLDGLVDIDRRHLRHAAEEASFMRLRKGDGIWMDRKQVILDSDGQKLLNIAKRAPPIPRIKGVAIANYRNDFLVGEDDAPTRSPRWNYLCNCGSPLGDPSGYRDLLWDGQVRYDSNGVEPHPGKLPFNFLSLSANGGHPGLGVNQQGSGENDLFVIAAYAVPRTGSYKLESAWVLAKDWERWSDRENHDLEVAVHVNDRELVFQGTIGPDGFINFNCKLGNLIENDVIYVGVGPSGDASRDSFKWNFTVVAD